MLRDIARIMLRLSRDTDEERDDLKSSWTQQAGGEYSSQKCVLCSVVSSLKSVNRSQTVHNRRLTPTRRPRDPPGLILFFSQFDQQSSHILSLPHSTLDIFPLIFTTILHFLLCPLPVS